MNKEQQIKEYAQKQTAKDIADWEEIDELLKEYEK